MASKYSNCTHVVGLGKKKTEYITVNLGHQVTDYVFESNHTDYNIESCCQLFDRFALVPVAGSSWGMLRPTTLSS